MITARLNGAADVVAGEPSASPAGASAATTSTGTPPPKVEPAPKPSGTAKVSTKPKQAPEAGWAMT